MYKWNDEKLEKVFNREKRYMLENKICNFTEDELSKTYLDSSVFKTKSSRIWRMITLGFCIGKLAGIKTVDEGKTPISLDPLESTSVISLHSISKEDRYQIQILYANYDEDSDCYGDIYTDVNECIKEHQNEKLMIGFGILDKLTGYLVDEVDEWFSIYEEAMSAREKLLQM